MAPGREVNSSTRTRLDVHPCAQQARAATDIEQGALEVSSEKIHCSYDVDPLGPHTRGHYLGAGLRNPRYLGPRTLSGVAVGSAVHAIAVWVALRALLGMYPGYGLDAVEELRRHTFSLLAALGVLAIFALSVHIGELLSRMLLGLAFTCLLLFAPLIRYLVKRGLKGTGLWGKPVMILNHKGNAANVTERLKRNWELGYNPVAVFGYRLEAKELRLNVHLLTTP